jgi:hypothetical protein
MPESTSNVEFAHRVHETNHAHEPAGHAPWIGIAEAILLAIVAVATAWSGFQAAKWDGVSAKQYALASRTTVLAQEKATLAGQDRLYDIVTFNGWVAAKVEGRAKLAAFYERRFRPEYAVAFRAWLKLDPVKNAAAPPGPTFMPQYTNVNLQASELLAKKASGYFEQGVDTRENGERYVQVTVFLATILFLTALSQRFARTGPRAAVIALAAILLVCSTAVLLTIPRA